MDVHFSSLDTSSYTIVLCEKCFLPFNNRLSVTPFFALTFVYNLQYQMPEFAGIWVHFFILEPDTVNS